MMKKLHLFIDTSEFIRNHFNFENISYQRLQNLCAKEDVILHTHDIIIKETESAIEKRSKAFELFLDWLPKNEKQLFRGLLKQYKKDSFVKKVEEFRTFLNRCKSKSLKNDFGIVGIDNIIKKFFSMEAPFSEKKKDEFPDAICIESIKKYIEDSGIQKFYIISQDPDWRSVFCDSTVVVCDNVHDFLNKYNTEIELHNKKFREEQERLSAYLNYEKIREKVKDKLLDTMIWLIDDEGEIGINDVQITDICDNGCEDNGDVVRVYLQLDVTFDVSVHYLSEEDSVWDSEEKQYIMPQYIDFDTEIEDSINCVIDVNKETLEIKIAEIYDGNEFRYSLR
ncbi:MAG: PIN domain-containing protein [Firmicutes bacterium]|nr:PIN domain-containing protein [Bacillota bacterium]